MSALKAKKLGYLAAATALLVLIVAQGCGGDDDSQAAPTGTAGKASAGAGDSVGGKADAGETSDNGGKTATPEGGAAGSPDTGSAGDKGEGGEGGAAPDCNGPSGCYSCAPTTNLQFLNSCVEGGCPAHFDNSTLSKLNLVGTL